MKRHQIILAAAILLGLTPLAGAHPGPGIVVTADGTIYFAYGPGHRIWKVAPDSATTALVVGSLDTDFRVPHHLFLDAQGQLITASDAHSAVWRIGADGTKQQIYPPKDWDGVGTVGLGGDPFALTPDGRIISIAGDQADHFSRIVIVDLDGTVTTLAGGKRGFADGTGEDAQFGYLALTAFAWGPDGNLYMTDEGRAVRRITMRGQVTTIAGAAEHGMQDGSTTSARLDGALGMAIAPDGSIFVADTRNRRIRLISPDGETSTFAGTGERGAKNGLAPEATFDEPVGITRASDGTLYVLEVPHGREGEYVRIRRIDADGNVTTHAVIPADRIAG